MSVGILEADKIVNHDGGNPVYIVGSATGKDGIQGASFENPKTSRKKVRTTAFRAGG